MTAFPSRHPRKRWPLPRGDTPIVICTAYSAWAFADYRRRGYRDLLLKPFMLHDLLAAVRRNLAHEVPSPAAPPGELGAAPPTTE